MNPEPSVSVDLTLARMLEGYALVGPKQDRNCSSILCDPRLLVDGNVFIALDGLTVHALDFLDKALTCLLYTSPSPRDQRGSRMPSSA